MTVVVLVLVVVLLFLVADLYFGLERRLNAIQALLASALPHGCPASSISVGALLEAVKAKRPDLLYGRSRQSSGTQVGADLLDAAKAVRAVRPVNWDDDEDPEQLSAWLKLDAAIARAGGDR